MFRDPHIAAQEKEIARLRDELAKAKADDKAMARKLMEAEAKLRREKAKPAKNPFPRFSRPRWNFPRFHLIHWLIGAFVVAFIAYSVYHYFSDIQEGVVTSKEYHPARTTCDDDGCTTYPEHWTVDIAYRGQTATWSVDESEYNRLRRGQWYCYTDLFHSQSNCDGPED